MKELRGVSVFFASPGGLAEERRAFKSVIDRVNRDQGHENSVVFIPEGWEYTISGVGRPQALINEQVRNSDYMIVVLHDDWGSSPGNGSRFTSGTEEEFFVALECLQDQSTPMRDVVVVFKGVPDSQLADPGPRLKKVLDFRKLLEESKVLLYSRFDSTDEFRDDLRAHLTSWLRDWTQEAALKIAKPNPFTVLGLMSSSRDESGVDSGRSPEQASLVKDAIFAAKHDRRTQAEELFARATTGTYDLEAFTAYARFLRKNGSLAHAEIVARKFLDAARDTDDALGEIEALANIALVKRQQGNNTLCLDYIRQAQDVADAFLTSGVGYQDQTRLSVLRSKAFLIDNESLTLRRMRGQFDAAVVKQAEAQEVLALLGDQRELAFFHKNMGMLLFRSGRLSDAAAHYTSALSLFESDGYASGQAATLGSVAELLELEGDFGGALEKLELSISIATERNIKRLSMNYGVLVRVLISLDRLGDASEYADECWRLGREVGTPEGLATGQHALAQVSLAGGKLEKARQFGEEAMKLFRDVDNPVGVIACDILLAEIAAGQGRAEEREYLLEDAARGLADCPHFALQKALEAARLDR